MSLPGAGESIRALARSEGKDACSWSLCSEELVSVLKFLFGWHWHGARCGLFYAPCQLALRLSRWLIGVAGDELKDIRKHCFHQTAVTIPIVNRFEHIIFIDLENIEATGEVIRKGK